MEKIYVGRLLEKIPVFKSLSDERYEKAMKRKYKTKYSKEDSGVDEESPISEGESLAVPPEHEPDSYEKGDSEERSEEKYFGKDVVISPLAYYTLDDSLKHALNDYKEQISRTVKLVMAKRAKYGQRAATVKDRNDVLGEYPEKNKTEVIVPDDAKTGPGLNFKRHYFTRPIDGLMYRITIDEQRTGIGQARRNTYMLIDIAIIFYRKNQIGLGKEIILRSRILRFRKRASRQSV
jgi:hypothetical protein